VARLGGSGELEADLERVDAFAYYREGDATRAVEHARRALSVGEKAWAPGSLRLARLDDTLGTALRLSHRREEAKQAHEAALAILERWLGPDHPALVPVLGNLGSVSDELERYDQSLVYYQRALEISERVDPRHPNVAIILTNLGVAQRALGRWQEALAGYRRALAISNQVFGREHAGSLTICLLAGLGICLEHLGHTDEAIATLERGLGLARAATDDVVYAEAELRFHLATALTTKARDPARARSLARAAAAGYTKAGEESAARAAAAWAESH
jgi:serine/threonine-protein kinase